MKKILKFFITFLTVFLMAACSAPAPSENYSSESSSSAYEEIYEEDIAEEEAVQEETAQEEIAYLDENGTYTTKEDVALYIYQYGYLPSNFITKNEARDLGWEGGSLEPFAPGMCIGGDKFGNYEGLLPDDDGRKYTECDINSRGKKSGAERIVFSNDGLIYYTPDHYETFELLYGEE